MMLKSVLVGVMIVCYSWQLGAVEPVAYPPIARVLPPVGMKPDEATTKKLRAEVEQLEADLKPYDPRDKQGNWNDPQFQYFADIAIFPKAIRWALDYDEFYKPADFATAEKQLKLGRERLEELKSGVKQPSWATQRGLTVRGYISPIDNSVQPYGVHVPENVDLSQKLPLYVWLHGRGEKVTDLHFIQERLTNRGKFAADDGITVHPFGRYCNAFKFMGERDVLDVMQQAEVWYKTDPRKRILIGFSMGGAGVWHIGSRYPHLFCAIAPGAGFSESREFLGITDDKLPPWYEQELWKWYDAPTYVENLFTLPVIAYSGEKDKQKQAADVMEREFAKHGKKLNHIIGPGMGHDYDKESLNKIAAFLKEAHRNVKPDTKIHSPTIGWKIPKTDKLLMSHVAMTKECTVPRSIDAAFMFPVLFVKPTGKSSNAQSQQWHDAEWAYQVDRWRRCFRGDLPWKNDVDVSAADEHEKILILFGGLETNLVAREALVLKQQKLQSYLDVVKHAPKLMENESIQNAVFIGIAQVNGRAIVLNSGPTFRDEHDRNNANQTPKLPDWAIIDVTTPPDGKASGKIVTAGFFDDEWKFVDPAKQEAEWKQRQK